MIDMIVRLYALPQEPTLVPELEAQGITLRRAAAYELHRVEDWVARHFSPKWVSESRLAMSRQPASCFIATKGGRIIGFACYDVTARGFIGPMGVEQSERSRGLGKALLLAALEALRAQGYAYAIIGGVGPAEFYTRSVGAMPIEGSSPGIYTDLLDENI